MDLIRSPQLLRLYSRLCILIVAMTLYCFLTTTTYADDWALAKEQNGVKISTRHIDESSIKAFRGQTQINAPIKDILDYMEVVASIPDWMADVKAISQIEHTGNVKIQHVLTDMPWPVRDRDGIYKLTLERESPLRAKIEIDAIPDYLPITDNVVRIELAHGYWLFEEKEGKTLVIYEMHVDPSGRLPSWIVNSAIVRAPYSTLLNLKQELEKSVNQIVR